MLEELDIDTDSLYLPLAVKNMEYCIRPEMKTEWQRLRSKDCGDRFTAHASGIFSPRICSDKHKKQDKREPGLFKEEFRCREMLCPCSKRYCCYDVVSNNFKFSSESFNKRVLEQSGNGPQTSTVASWMKKLYGVKKQRFPHQQSHQCYVRTSEEKTIILLSKKNYRE